MSGPGERIAWRARAARTIWPSTAHVSTSPRQLAWCRLATNCASSRCGMCSPTSEQTAQALGGMAAGSERSRKRT